MARSKAAGVDAATATAEPVSDDQQQTIAPASHDELPRWRYVGPDRRIYTSVPVTVDPGDVVPCAEIPASDGFWQETDQPYNRLPDNHTGV